MKARILVIDDNEDTTLTSVLLLRHKGHTVIAANSGTDALAGIQEFKPDVVLLDISMPSMDGYELAWRIRHEVGYEHVVIVAISGYIQERETERSIAAEIDHHLLKPIKPEDLDKILKDWEGDRPAHC